MTTSSCAPVTPAAAAPDLLRGMPWPGTAEGPESEALLTREWLVTNGLGGYASGTVSGVTTRRYHGLLVAAMPAPYGRVVMLNHVTERVKLPDGRRISLGGEQRVGSGPELHGARDLREFRLESGLPVWVFDLDGWTLEKRLLLPHGQNTVHLGYALAAGEGTVRLDLQPSVHFRHHEAPVSQVLDEPYALAIVEDQVEITAGALPPLRLRACGEDASLTVKPQRVRQVLFQMEERRGYESSGDLWSPGYFRVEIAGSSPATLIASTEPWERIRALEPDEATAAERQRRRRLLVVAPEPARHGLAAELVLAADQFIITPAGRVEDAARARAAGDEVRTIVAGYHWFTDWGRDTMISLEGLTLTTGRRDEARNILRTFGFYVRDGLIPNLFPEGDSAGLYNTADATLWFFHALHRYLQVTGDWSTLQLLLPKLDDAVRRHVAGTRFNIGVDPADGLLRQGADKLALTWMDAKMGDWVVTPRRGKAVEINALWYNALRLLADWHAQGGGETRAAELRDDAARVRTSFNRRFWYEQGQHLYDVIDGEAGDDNACRPNQILAVALDYPVLEESRWKVVVDIVERRLLTPVGLRSLDPAHPDYRSTYSGDLRSRDGAYHQGTVWAWLIGPFVDAWVKTHPGRAADARQYLTGLVDHLDATACVGSISEIFDAEEPFTPRGCVAQAWSVAELLRCWVKTGKAATAPLN
jgi:predicted glycogen debranching enzyme